MMRRGGEGNTSTDIQSPVVINLHGSGERPRRRLGPGIRIVLGCVGLANLGIAAYAFANTDSGDQIEQSAGGILNANPTTPETTTPPVADQPAAPTIVCDNTRFMDEGVVYQTCFISGNDTFEADGQTLGALPIFRPIEGADDYVVPGGEQYQNFQEAMFRLASAENVAACEKELLDSRNLIRDNASELLPEQWAQPVIDGTSSVVILTASTTDPGVNIIATCE